MSWSRPDLPPGFVALTLRYTPPDPGADEAYSQIRLHEADWDEDPNRVVRELLRHLTKLVTAGP